MSTQRAKHIHKQATVVCFAEVAGKGKQRYERDSELCDVETSIVVFRYSVGRQQSKETP